MLFYSPDFQPFHFNRVAQNTPKVKEPYRKWRNPTFLTLGVFWATQISLSVKYKLYSQMNKCYNCTLQMNKCYKKMNRNTEFWQMIFVSYSRIRIFKIRILIHMKGIQILIKHIPFIRNRILKFYQPICLQTNRIEFILI